MFIDISLCLLIFRCVYWYFVVFIDISLCLLIFRCVYWYFVVFIDIWLCLLIFRSVYWYFVVFIDISQCLLIFRCVSWYYCLSLFNICLFTINTRRWWIYIQGITSKSLLGMSLKGLYVQFQVTLRAKPD